MAGINKVILLGNLGNDPKITTFESGSKVANLSVATSKSWKDKETGEKKEFTEWHRVALFGYGAEFAEKYLKKGDKVYIEGELRTRSYEKDGQTHYTTEIYTREIQGLTPNPNGANTIATEQAKHAAETMPPPPENGDVLPF